MGTGESDAGGESGPEVLAPGVVVPSSALRFSYSRSAGPGGQNVNKRSTRAQLRVGVAALGLAPGPLARLERAAGSLLTAGGELVISADESRSQKLNRRSCVSRLQALVREAVRKPKVRRPTKPTAGSERRRLEAKKQRGEIKKQRGWLGPDG